MNRKKNFRKIPPIIHAAVKSIQSDSLVVVCVRNYSVNELSQGLLTHLKITLGEKGIEAPTSIIPSNKQGKYSNENINGKVIIRKDLPKETHYNMIHAPNFGDSSKGYHYVNLPYKKYPRDFIAPSFNEIKIEILSEDLRKETVLIKFEVSEILNKKDPNFEQRLFFCINLLQENVGKCGVDVAGKKAEEYLHSYNIAWEVLPPGTKEETIQRLIRGRSVSDQERLTMESRYDFFMSLNPKELIQGTTGLTRYFGALIREDLVVFENIEYGNAVYIMFKDWKAMSKLSRIELLSGRFGNNFKRIVHGNDWKKKVKEVITLN